MFVYCPCKSEPVRQMMGRTAHLRNVDHQFQSLGTPPSSSLSKQTLSNSKNIPLLRCSTLLGCSAASRWFQPSWSPGWKGRRCQGPELRVGLVWTSLHLALVWLTVGEMSSQGLFWWLTTCERVKPLAKAAKVRRESYSYLRVSDHQPLAGRTLGIHKGQKVLWLAIKVVARSLGSGALWDSAEEDCCERWRWNETRQCFVGTLGSFDRHILAGWLVWIPIPVAFSLRYAECRWIFDDLCMPNQGLKSPGWRSILGSNVSSVPWVFETWPSKRIAVSCSWIGKAISSQIGRVRWIVGCLMHRLVATCGHVAIPHVRRRPRCVLPLQQVLCSRVLDVSGHGHWESVLLCCRNESTTPPQMRFEFFSFRWTFDTNRYWWGVDSSWICLHVFASTKEGDSIHAAVEKSGEIQVMHADVSRTYIKE